MLHSLHWDQDQLSSQEEREVVYIGFTMNGGVKKALHWANVS